MTCDSYFNSIAPLVPVYLSICVICWRGGGGGDFAGKTDRYDTVVGGWVVQCRPAEVFDGGGGRVGCRACTRMCGGEEEGFKKTGWQCPQVIGGGGGKGRRWVGEAGTS